MSSMLTTGVIRNGRVVVAEPIDLPDGSEVTISERVPRKDPHAPDDEAPSVPNHSSGGDPTEDTYPTLLEVVAKIQATKPNPAQFRPPSGNLADLLWDAPNDPKFNLEDWSRQWSAVEAEMKAVTRSNDIAENRWS